MSRYSTKIRCSLLVIALLTVTASAPLFGQSGACDVNRDVGTKALDEITWKQMNKVYEKVGVEDYDGAYQDLVKMLGRAGKRDSYLRAVLNQALAQVEWSRENYDSALKYFERAVELDALPNQAHFALMYQIAQLYYMKERYDEALTRLGLWFCTVPKEQITAHPWVLKATILAQKGDYAAVLPAIDTAIAMGPEPKENWYLLKLAAHYELDQYPEAAATLEVMIVGWPEKKAYWTQLSQIYYKLKQSGKALAVMALAHRKQLLDKQGDLTFLSSLYSNEDVPYKAAEVLEKGIRDEIVEPTLNHWTVVADAWYAAEELEKALKAYDEAGQVAEDGNIDLRRGYILVDLERWPAALEAMDRALEKGGLNDRKMGEAYLLRGMAQFSLGNLDSASADWGRAGRYEKSKKAARQWLNHLQEERQRKAP